MNNALSTAHRQELITTLVLCQIVSQPNTLEAWLVDIQQLGCLRQQAICTDSVKQSNNYLTVKRGNKRLQICQNSTEATMPVAGLQVRQRAAWQVDQGIG